MKTFDEFISEWRRGPGGTKVRIEPFVTRGRGKKKERISVGNLKKEMEKKNEGNKDSKKLSPQQKAVVTRAHKPLRAEKEKRRRLEDAEALHVTGKYSQATKKQKIAQQKVRIDRGKEQHEKNKTKPRATYKDRSVPQHHPDKKTDKHGDYVERQYPTGVYQSRTRDNRSDPYKGKNRWNWPETSRKKTNSKDD